jgi:2-polyprenyl-3-methyl-5-hydroxy-6-metoxy-1,4-benzoquinol methylase
MSCPYCEGNKFKKSFLRNTSFNNKIFDYLTCLECEVIYIHPLPSEKDYEVMYHTDYQGELSSLINTKYFDLFREITKINNKFKKVLDYGCGNAELLVNAKAENFNCTGVEYNPKMVDKLNNFFEGISFISVEDFDAQFLKYDVIILNNVLEHVINPNEILKKLKNKLEEGGLLVVLGPIENNFNIAFQFRKFIFQLSSKFNKIASHYPYHITFTNYTNQRKIFAKHNFEEILYEVKEVAWPDPQKISTKSFDLFVKSLIAFTSIRCSKIFSKNAGNIFKYIGRNTNYEK